MRRAALPQKRTRPRMGVREIAPTVFNRHRRFVKGHGCSVPGCKHQDIDFAHVKSRGAGSHDAFGVSLCRAHHIEQHRRGVRAFGRKYGIDLWRIAAAFVRRSPDGKMRESFERLPLPKQALLFPERLAA